MGGRGGVRKARGVLAPAHRRIVDRRRRRNIRARSHISHGQQPAVEEEHHAEQREEEAKGREAEADFCCGGGVFGGGRLAEGG